MRRPANDRVEHVCDVSSVTLFATDAALAWRAKKKTTTTQQPLTVDSNFTCEYDAEGTFAGTSRAKVQ